MNTIVNSIINSIETAKLNLLEFVVTDQDIKDNLSEAIRAEARYLNAVAATAGNIATHFGQQHAELIKTGKAFSNLFSGGVK